MSQDTLYLYNISKKNKIMAKPGIARYDEKTNTLFVIRPNENTERKIKCRNLNLRTIKVFDV
jgi:hypothetical protein